MTAKYKRRIIAIRGDTQAGHDGGLKNPETLLPVISLNEKGDRTIIDWAPVHMRPIQRRLWAWHEEGREAIKKLAGTDPITLIEMGDMTQGVIFKDDVAEADLDEQYFIAKGTMTAWLKMPQVKQMYIAKGTGVHTWNGSTEAMLTRELKQEYKKPVQLADHWLLNVGGFLMDIAHHGPGPGKRNWLKGNEFRWYLQSLLMDDLDRGGPVPAIVIRAHNHDYTRKDADHQTRDKYWRVEGIITPPLCFIGLHAQKMMHSPSGMGMGLLALEIINGKLHDVHPFMHYVDLRTLEVVA